MNEQTTENFLRQLMNRYTVDNLVDIIPKDFKAKIDEFLTLEDPHMEGYESGEMQRDLSVKFHWGHDHDFGDFKLKGKLGDRHIELMKVFIDNFGLPRELDDKKMLDVGPWTGGTSLLLAAMGAHVEAVEEVQKYSWLIRYLARAFDAKIKSYSFSLYYAWDKKSRYDYFDYVIFTGVLYHLTDPILALRIIFNSLKDGGKVFIESACQFIRVYPSYTLEYKGPHEKGWNWFIPSEPTLRRMLSDVGFEDVQTHFINPVDGRVYAVATRKKHKDMLRAGLSRASIR